MQTKQIFFHQNNQQKISSGIALVEALVALALFAVIAATGVTALSLTLRSGTMSTDRLRATLLAKEGLEAAQQLQQSDWSNLAVGTSGLVWNGTSWTQQGTTDLSGKFQRSISVDLAQRDGSGTIVETGEADPETKQVTSTVSWQVSPIKTESVSFQTFLTNYFEPIGSPIGNWAFPLRELGIDLTGTHNALQMTIANNQLYLTRASGTPNFMVFDLTNPLSPSVTGSTTLSNNLRQVANWNSYSYIASTNNTSEVQIVDVSNPSAPIFLNSLNLPGNNDAIGIAVNADILYVGRAGSFLTYAITTPTAGSNGLTQLSNANLGGSNTPVDFSFKDDQVCFATTNTTAQIYCALIGSPTNLSSLTIPGNSAGTSIARSGNSVYVGLVNGTIAVVDLSLGPTSLSLVSTYSTGGAVRGLSAIPTQKTLFASTANTAKEVQVINANNSASLVELGFFNSASTPIQFSSILYHAPADVVYATYPSNTEEITVYKPTPL